MEIAAYHMTTQKQWADIVLNSSTLEQISLIKAWLQHHRVDIIDKANKTYTGYKTLFYGPSGTGKSLTAALLGQESNSPVYRIDLSGSVSKYIGETEKNLDLLFQRAEDKGWILFFDEADALFGKRTGVNDSHDRYANEETSYLLEKIGEYNGLVILATNMRSNIDEAFTRRLQSVIHFPLPDASERKRIWQLGLSGSKLVEERIDLAAIAEQYPLSPASIIHIIQSINDNPSATVSAATTYTLLVKEIETENAKQQGKQILQDH